MLDGDPVGIVNVDVSASVGAARRRRLARPQRSRVAVAMRYSAVDARVPMLVTRAEEAGQVLAFIRAAKRRDLPIVHDLHLARALFDKVEIGKRIPRQLFQPVIDCMNQIPKA